MKAHKRQIINHIKAAKPFMYQKYSLSKPHTIYIAKSFENQAVNDDGSVCYSLQGHFIGKDAKLHWSWDMATITLKQINHGKY